ncbi:MAG: TrkA family potassium uptake protein [Clostridia bacterium]|nr:TrkA family potassium uptake protein [Clostridia bacterium]
MTRDKQFAVLGLGSFGMSLAYTLSKNGFDVLAADNNPDKVQAASEFVTHAVIADAGDESALRALGIGNFDYVIVTVGDSLETAVMATLVAKDAGAKHVVVKAKDETQRKILEKIGADRVVFPDREMGERIANSLIYGDFYEFMELSNDLGIAEFEVPVEWKGHTLSQLAVRAKYGINLIAIKRNNNIDATLTADTMFEENDVIVAMGETKKIQKFLDKIS